jgi:hypothetical protein
MAIGKSDHVVALYLLYGLQIALGLEKYGLFQKEPYIFGSVYEFIQGTYTTF